MQLNIGASKIKKYATSQSGDTLEFIERPDGGISLVLADGQRSGKSAKVIANKVVSKVIALLSDGVRDGAAARAASDYLYHERRGKVMATLNILSVDLMSKTLVMTRNNPAPVFVARDTTIQTHDEPSDPVGVKARTRPVIHELPLETGLTVLVYTDGISNAGVRTSESLDIHGIFQALVQAPNRSAQSIADEIMQEALTLDRGRPADDISILVMRVHEQKGDGVRRVSLTLPLGVP